MHADACWGSLYAAGRMRQTTPPSGALRPALAPANSQSPAPALAAAGSSKIPVRAAYAAKLCSVLKALNKCGSVIEVHMQLQGQCLATVLQNENWLPLKCGRARPMAATTLCCMATLRMHAVLGVAQGCITDAGHACG